jgi:outer membrane protein OmpA-like peptidoglycan-associated protein
VRASCLSVLTRARRGVEGAPGHPDTLLAELSAASGWDPLRDERGVVVTLRDAFAAHGAALTTDAESKLKELGRVAKAHPTFALQIVLHDAAPGDAALAAKRGDAVSKALVAGGADPAKTKVELAGAAAPVVDPQDTARKGRNERLELVFVAPQN